MDEQDSKPKTGNDTNGDDYVIPPIQPQPTYHPEHPVHSPDNQNPSQNQGWYVPKRKRRKWKAYGRQFCRAGADRHIELIIAAAVLVFVGLQYGMMRSNNKSTSRQICKIIKAADGISVAASSFSMSASNINDGVGEAVTKLQLQVDQVKRSAKAAEGAVKTAQNQMRLDERAWVGVEATPVTHLNDFGNNTVVGPGPTIRVASVAVIARNTGKTPALHWKISCLQSQDVDFTQDIRRIPDCEKMMILNRKRDIDKMTTSTLQTDPKMPVEIARKKATDRYNSVDTAEKAETERNVGEVIAPSASRTLDLTTAVPPLFIPQVHYVVGTMTYYDILDPTKKRYTRFCVKRIGRSGQWSLCPFGQDMN